MLDLKTVIRAIPDFPKPGILFRDITTLLNNPQAFKQTIDQMADMLKGKKIDYIVAAESRGFIFAGPLAYKLGAGLVLVRKPGKLPSETHSAAYSLEYGQDSLEIHQDAFLPGSKVLVLDDLLATGGTAKAMVELVKKLDSEVAGIMFVIELDALEGRKKFPDTPIYTLIHY